MPVKPAGPPSTPMSRQATGAINEVTYTAKLYCVSFTQRNIRLRTFDRLWKACVKRRLPSSAAAGHSKAWPCLARVGIELLQGTQAVAMHVDTSIGASVYQGSARLNPQSPAAAHDQHATCRCAGCCCGFLSTYSCEGAHGTSLICATVVQDDAKMSGEAMRQEQVMQRSCAQGAKRQQMHVQVSQVYRGFTPHDRVHASQPRHDTDTHACTAAPHQNAWPAHVRRAAHCGATPQQLPSAKNQ